MTSSWEQGASLYQGRRAIGGRIKVGRGEFVFTPHVFDRNTGGNGFRTNLNAIVSVEKTKRSWRLSTFSPRECLMVRTAGGSYAKFLMNKLDSVVARLNDSIREAGGSEG